MGTGGVNSKLHISEKNHLGLQFEDKTKGVNKPAGSVFVETESR